MAQRLLRSQSEQLVFANKELEAFSYSVSHDLRAPLRAAKGFSAILLKEYGNLLDAEGQDYLTRISGAADRMNALIDDMLSLAKISQEKMDLREMDLSALASPIVNDLQRAEPQRKVEVVTGQGLNALCDERLMKIALSNLIGNAWKYSAGCDALFIAIGKRFEGIL
jgi:signal transduction histidine kinase